MGHNEWGPMAPTGHQDNNKKISGQGGLGKCQLSVKIFPPTSETCVYAIHMAQNLEQEHL